VLDSGLLRVLAQLDVHETVSQVQEFHADFLPMNSDLWTLQCRTTIGMTVAAGTSWTPKYERNVQGLQSMLLALKKQPALIRYAGHSP
jgi:vacuolar protein sorting-associated protein 45